MSLPKKKMSAVHRTYYRKVVQLLVDGVPIDPTGLDITFAVVPEGQVPTDADKKAGDWETIHHPALAYIARTLVGVSDNEVTADFAIEKGSTYDAYFWLSDDPELLGGLVGKIIGV